MRFVLYSPAQARLKARGEYSMKRSSIGMIALQKQAEKFLGRLFSKRRDLRRFLKAAVKGSQ
jgi:coproporphyrinogen III oxidase-like Fe-S oxidoreductase